MMKNIIIILTLALVLYGCASINTTSGNNENYNTGSQGLVVSFLPNTPPAKIYDDENFKVVLEIKNMGSTDIDNTAKLYLSGFDTSIITGIQTYGTDLGVIEGKDMYTLEGGVDTFSFDGMVRDLQSREIDFFDTTLLATLCYSYETIAAPTVCVDPDPYSRSKEKKVCSATDVQNLKGSQAAPIAVSSVTVEPQPGKSRFQITISNVGGGTVFRNGGSYLAKCNPYSPTKLEYEDVDFVELIEVKVGDQIITQSCKPTDDNHIRMTSGSGTFWCELDGLTGSTYTTPMKIKLRYNYRYTAEKSIRIVQTP